jgi:Flp pilus assembly protein TadG
VAGLEFVLVAASLIALIFGAIQVGLWYYARDVVVAAANQGAQAASVGGGTDAVGRQAAERALASLGGLGTSPSVNVMDAGGDVTVSTSTSVASVVPFLPAVVIRASVAMHREP